MKVKTTAKAVKNSADKLVYVGYCDLHYLLRAHNPTAYTCGIYGWNFDVYEVYGLTICTGYRNLPGRRANGVSEYEKRARAIWDDRFKTWEEREAAVDSLLADFVRQA